MTISGYKAFQQGVCVMASLTKGNSYTVIEINKGVFSVVKIMSEHDKYDDAISTMVDIVQKEGKEMLDEEVKKAREKGIKVTTVRRSN